jgi:TrmH family RNA methyltransferase
MRSITSPHNTALKEMRRLAGRRERERAGRFVAEGEDLIAAAEAAGWQPLAGYRAAGAGVAGESPGAGSAARAPESSSAGFAARAPGRGFAEVEPSALAKVSALGSGTRMAAIYEQRWQPGAEGPLCVYLNGLADPGNVGAVLRSAHAFGASTVAIGPRCADPYSPKAVRASMGAVFAVGLARVDALAQLPGERIALVAHAGEPLHELARERRSRHGGPGPVTLVLGAERQGLPAELVGECDAVAHIPIASDSLNVAMAATIALYEMTRVRP